MLKKRTAQFNKRSKTLKEKIKLFAIIFIILSLTGMTIWSVIILMESRFLKAEVEWKIDKKIPISHAVLKNSVQVLINNKYWLNTSKIKQLLELHPWVAKVHFTEQRFSNNIQINIKSRKIAMRWKNTNCNKKLSANCTGYISINGKLFTPKKQLMSNAPLALSNADQETVSHLYQDYKIYQKQVGKMSIKSFLKNHIDQITLKPNIKVILGYRHQQKRLKRFLIVYKQLRKKISRKKLNQATFDMRYPKAFALTLI